MGPVHKLWNALQALSWFAQRRDRGISNHYGHCVSTLYSIHDTIECELFLLGRRLISFLCISTPFFSLSCIAGMAWSLSSYTLLI